jgi:hypothetical protein
MAPAYYGEAYHPAKHFNALLRSARKVYNLNNYLIPTEMTEEVLENSDSELTLLVSLRP